jgi:ParB-like chromosome segregation protein Spo0J
MKPKSERAATLETKRVKLADLKPHPKNPRAHPKPGSAEWEALKKSLEADYFQPLVVNSGRTVKRLRSVIVSGHLRVKVLMAEGYTHADAVIVDYTEERHVQVMLRANNQTGEWDETMLAGLLKDIPDTELDLTGFGSAEIDRLLSGLGGRGAMVLELAVSAALAMVLEAAGERCFSW